MSFLIAQPAPDFNATVVNADGVIEDGFTLSQFKGDKYIVLFFWPLDFTFVCPSEIIAFDKAVEEFEARNVQVVGCSIDSQFTHFAWRNTARDAGGIGAVRFPMVADIDKSISRDYGVLLNDSVALRGTFVIDTDGVVQSAVVNNLPIGRSIAETIRVVDALQHHEQHGEVCPANWNKGDDAMTATADGVASYLAKHG